MHNVAYLPNLITGTITASVWIGYRISELIDNNNPMTLRLAE